LYQEYRDRVAFYIVYIREAHPTDGWGLPSNTADNVLYAQPQTSAERQEVASACALRLRLTIPVLIDAMDNRADCAFNGWPERLYLLSADGHVAYQGGKGPYGFDPDELERFLREMWSAR
jgi:hypothetical protein